jgi:phage gpG-like protein
MAKRFPQTSRKIEKLIDYLHNDVPVIIGTEAVNHFKESFQNEGFTDKSLDKWDEVERRKSSSGWYGFQYKANANKPEVKRRKENSSSNYSPAATQRAILTGTTQELKNSIQWERIGNIIRIKATVPYAKLMNEGGDMKVFGKTTRKMKQRQFMGKSAVLKAKLEQMIADDIKQILR